LLAAAWYVADGEQFPIYVIKRTVLSVERAEIQFHSSAKMMQIIQLMG
jgi:hypothetical protein